MPDTRHADPADVRRAALATAVYDALAGFGPDPYPAQLAASVGWAERDFAAAVARVVAAARRLVGVSKRRAARNGERPVSYLQTSPEIYHEHRAGCRCVCGRRLPTATLTQTPPPGRLCARCVAVRAAQEKAMRKLRRADDER